MPFINTKTTLILDRAKKDVLTAALCEITEKCLNKNRTWLMTNFEDGADIYFRGAREEKLAYIEVKLCGNSGSEAYNKMTAQICSLFEKELQIPADHTYVSYYPTDDWGWNNVNF